MQHAILMAGTGHLDMVGQLEPALEGAGGDAAMQEAAAFVGLGFPGGHDQAVFLDLDAQIFCRETGHGDRDTVGIIGGLFDVVGGIGL